MPLAFHPPAPSSFAPQGLVPSLEAETDRLPLRIVWDAGRLSEWAALLAACGQSALTQGFGYAQAYFSIDGWRPRLGIIELSDRPVGLIVIAQKTVAGLVQLVRLHRGPLFIPEARRPIIFALTMRALRQAYPAGWRRRVTVIPEWPAGEEGAAIMRWAGWRCLPGPGYLTSWLDLRRPLPDLRAALRQKWRHALHQAERADLSIAIDPDGAQQLPNLLRRYEADRRAKGYRGPSPRFLIRLRTGMRKDGDILLLEASQSDEQGVSQPVAGILILGHGKAATYQVGWTSPAGRAARAHHALLWRAIETLQAQGRHWLDLGGLLPDGAPGVTAFKRGLGGEEVELLGAWR
jgi:Acetyltransferase (GNAT) domain